MSSGVLLSSSGDRLAGFVFSLSAHRLIIVWCCLFIVWLSFGGRLASSAHRLVLSYHRLSGKRLVIVWLSSHGGPILWSSSGVVWCRLVSSDHRLVIVWSLSGHRLFIVWLWWSFGHCLVLSCHPPVIFWSSSSGCLVIVWRTSRHCLAIVWPSSAGCRVILWCRLVVVW